MKWDMVQPSHFATPYYPWLVSCHETFIPFFYVIRLALNYTTKAWDVADYLFKNHLETTKRNRFKLSQIG